MVGAAGFEPATLGFQSRHATRLRHVPLYFCPGMRAGAPVDSPAAAEDFTLAKGRKSDKTLEKPRLLFIRGVVSGSSAYAYRSAGEWPAMSKSAARWEPWWLCGRAPFEGRGWIAEPYLGE